MLLAMAFSITIATLASSAAVAQSYARLEIVSGDRQIVVGTQFPQSPPKPYKVRALDAAGKPVQGVTLLIGPAAAFDGPILVDEFGYRGFNTPFFGNYSNFGDPHPVFLAATDSNGIATASGPYWDQPSSASLVGAGQYPGSWQAPQAFFFVNMLQTAPPGNPSLVVEYFNSSKGHYFNTLLDNEIALLDPARLRAGRGLSGLLLPTQLRKTHLPTLFQCVVS